MKQNQTETQTHDEVIQELQRAEVDRMVRALRPTVQIHPRHFRGRRG